MAFKGFTGMLSVFCLRPCEIIGFLNDLDLLLEKPSLFAKLEFNGY